MFMFMGETKGASTETLLTIRGNLLEGLENVGKHVKAGTLEVAQKEGSAPPTQSGWLTLILLLGVEDEDELEATVRGFTRALDPKLFSKAP